MPIDPVILARVAAVAPTAPPADPAERRALALAGEQRFWAEHGLATPDVDVVDVAVPVPDGPDVSVRIYRPHGATDPLPSVVTFFGGAFRQGGLQHPVTDWLHRIRAAEAGVAVLGIDYALAPERPFPAARDQGVAVLEWVAAHGAAHGLDPARIAVGGQSSGGNLAACVALHVRGRMPIAFQLLEVPVLDLTAAHMSFEVLAEVGLPEAPVRADHDDIRSTYLGEHDGADPEASPLLEPDLRGVAPAYLLLAEYDVLRGDGEAYHARLREAGVPSSATVALGQTHDSAGDPSLLASRHWQYTVVAILRGLHDLP